MMPSLSAPEPQTIYLDPSEVRTAYIEESAKWIQMAASVTAGGCAAILGCGNCQEIPLSCLEQTFQHVDFVDIDERAIHVLRDKMTGYRARHDVFQVHHADLTGVSPKLEAAAREVVGEASDPHRCLGELAELLVSASPLFWSAPGGTCYDLVVCSSVLTQLQARVRSVVEAAFLERFQAFAFALRSQEQWRRCAWQFARNLEHGFVDHLRRLAGPNGVIYLSDTIQVWWLKQVGPKEFESPGYWLTTESSRLRDYLPPWVEILAEGGWPWILERTEGPYWGRLYGCQALICRGD